MPLSQELREKDSLSDANLESWFNGVEGSKHSNVLGMFASVDTADESFPAPLNSESVPINLRLFEEYASSAKQLGGETHDLNMIIEGLKKRLDYLNTYYMKEEQQKAY